MENSNEKPKMGAISMMWCKWETHLKELCIDTFNMMLKSKAII